jgi:urease accessory protein
MPSKTPNALSCRHAWLGLVLLALVPVGAWAHAGSMSEHIGAPHGFVDGFVHPFTGFDHIGAIVAAGLWAARGERRMWAVPVILVTSLVLGALVSASGLLLLYVEPLIAFSLLALGLLLASRTYLPPAFALALIGGFAFCHGVAHGIALGGTAALVGLACGSAALCGCGILAGLALRQRSPWWTRGTGLALALFGITQLARW